MNNTLKKRLLYADASDVDVALLTQAFGKEGYDVFFVNDGKNVIEEAVKIQADVFILDVELPNIDGVELCVELRKLAAFVHTPILFVSARMEDYTQIAALEAGADDYLLKPTRPRLIVSHLKAIERRYVQARHFTIENSIEAIEFHAELDIDEERIGAIVGGVFVYLPRKEFEILKLLISKPGRVFSRSEIFSRVWDNQTGTNERTIDVHIRKLRKKIGEDFIVTHKGIGYKVNR